MAEEMEKMVSSHADIYLQREKARLAENFRKGCEEVFETQVQRVREELAEFYAGHLSALEGGISTEKLLEIRKRI